MTCRECGKIPTFLENCVNLTSLTIKSFGTLNGTIPKELGRLRNLEKLDLTEGALTGSIPSEFQDLTSLKELYLGTNDLTGSIYEYMFTNSESSLSLSLSQ